MTPWWMILFGPLALAGASAAWLAKREPNPTDRAVLLGGGLGLVAAPAAAWTVGNFDAFTFGYLAVPFGISIAFLWRSIAAKASKATSRFYNVAGLSIFALTGLPLLVIFAVVELLGGRVGH